MTKVAYVRVSTTEQNLDAQRDAVTNAGAERLFEEKKSGVDQDRPVLKECLRYLREGDELIAVRADRIARSAPHLLTLLDDLDKRGVKVTFLTQPELSSTGPYGRFLRTVLAGVAQLEREIIKERQADGIKAAKARGTKFGRKAKLNAEVVAKVKALKAAGEPLEAIKERTGLGKTSIYEALKA